MCGIFGFISRRGAGPAVERLRALAVFTATRGRDAFGLAWATEDGATEIFKAVGPAEWHLQALQRCRDATIVIGHCRLATHGTPDEHRNNHPHAAGRGQFVHNGVVANYAALRQRYGLRPTSECDSEVLGLLMARHHGSLLGRGVWAAQQALGDLALLGLWTQPNRLLVVRRGKPLHFGRAPEGGYFASLPYGLPGPVAAVPDDSAQVFVRGGRAPAERRGLVEGVSRD